MSRLIRLDRTGHTELAQWNGTDGGFAAAQQAFSAGLGQGFFAVATRTDGTAEQIRELPLDAELVVLRRPIAGG